MEEDVSVYDIADHPDFHFRTTDIVIRIWNSENGQNDCENEVRTIKLFFHLLVFHVHYIDGVFFIFSPPSLTWGGQNIITSQY